MPINVANWGQPAANVEEPYYLYQIQPGLVDADGRSYVYRLIRADAERATVSGMRDATEARNEAHEYARKNDTYVVTWRVDQTGVYVEDVWFPEHLKGDHTKL